ncbi:hypothetical protein WCLP8_2690002 [uncultured Gammaproteobacteria bacterium]
MFWIELMTALNEQDRFPTPHPAPPRPASLPSRSRAAVGRLVIGFVGLTTLGAVVGLCAILFITRIEDQLHLITQFATPAAETAEDMIIAFWESVAAAEEVLTESDSKGVTRQLERFNKLSGEFEANQQRLEALIGSGSLKEKIESARSDHGKYMAYVRDLVKARKLTLGQMVRRTTAGLAFETEADDLVRLCVRIVDRHTSHLSSGTVGADNGGMVAAKYMRSVVSALLGGGLGGGTDEAAADGDLPMISTSLKLEAGVVGLRETAYRYLAETRSAALPPLRKRFETLVAEINTQIAALQRLETGDAESKQTGDLIARITSWISDAQAVDGLLETHRRVVEADNSVQAFTAGFEKEAADLVINLRAVAEHTDAVSRRADSDTDYLVKLAIISTSAMILLMTALASMMIVRLVRGVD